MGRFLAGIGALIWRPDTLQYLVLKRSAAKDFGANLWECVTGRVEQGESFADAVRREVQEELGVEARYEFVIGTTHFYRGDATPENELLGIVCCCTVSEPTAIRLSPEHSESRWIKVNQLESLLGDDPSETWLGSVVARAEAIRSHMTPAIAAVYRAQGLELG